MKSLGIPLLDIDINTFIKESTLETMKASKENAIVRHDMINLLMQAREGQLTHGAEEKTVEGFATVNEQKLEVSAEGKNSLG